MVGTLLNLKKNDLLKSVYIENSVSNLCMQLNAFS